MAVDPNTIALGVNSLVSANLSAVTVTLNDVILSPEKCPQVNVVIPGFSLLLERVGAPRTEKQYSIPVDLYHWGEEPRAAWQNMGALVNSVSAIFQNRDNRTLGGNVEMSRLASGEPIDAPSNQGGAGVYVGYRLIVEADTLETN